MSKLYDFEADAIDGSAVTFDRFKGKVLLIVNTASKCGFTSQYQGLNDLYRKYKDQGFEVLGFPCNQFGHQEPGTETEIQQFCDLNYKIEFPLFAKIDVNGDTAHPLYKWLKAEAPGVLGTEAIKWNFTKFLVDAEGNVVQRFASMDKPESIAQDVTTLLKEK